MTAPVDYLLLCACSLAVFVGLHLWLKRRHSDFGLPRGVAVAVVLTLGLGAVLVERLEDQTIERLKRAIVGLAPTYAMEVERLGHAAIGLETPAADPTYLGIIDAEKRWLAANPVVNDIYTFRRLDAENVTLIVDSETDYDHDGVFEGERETRTDIGETLKVGGEFVTAAAAGRGGLDPQPYTDRWGTWVSAYWPLRDAQGRVEAILAVDYGAAPWMSEVRGARASGIAVTALVLLLLFAGSALYVLQRVELEARRAAADAMRQARDAAEGASRLKSQFLACMSHEIRTPMNGVMGVTELLLATKLDSKQAHFGKLIFRSAANLLAVINDILDYSKIEANRLELELLPFAPRDVIEDVGELLGGRASAKWLELVIDYPVSSPRMLRGDSGRVRQILTNLVSNAIKFTEKGEVAVVVTWSGLDGERPRMRCEVRDTGPGLDAATRATLFEPFVQADRSITRRYGGTGLGLAICRRLVELMEGEIGCESKPGQGSTFWFELPFSRTEALTLDPGAALQERELEGLHGLIVDDNDTNREILEHLLAAWGVRSGSAADADAALAMLEATAEAGAPFDFAILDYQMPGRDGLDLAAAIREHPALAGIRLVMLSSISDADADGERDWRTVGVDANLSKPARHAVLFRELRQLLRTDRGATGSTGTVRIVDASPDASSWDGTLQLAGRVLLAEDNAVNQLIAEEMLASLGLEVDLAGDGHAALEAVESVARPYDAILMDCEMPGMDGRTATRELRRREAATPGARRMPVIALTAQAADSDREACLAAGMDDYLSKPMTRAQLAAMLAKWIGQDAAPGGGAQPGAAAPAAASPRAASA
jgi:signal transduction histidine kinase/CheY-like chemotaxis protein